MNQNFKHFLNSNEDMFIPNIVAVNQCIIVFLAYICKTLAGKRCPNWPGDGSLKMVPFVVDVPAFTNRVFVEHLEMQPTSDLP